MEMPTSSAISSCLRFLRTLLRDRSSTCFTSPYPISPHGVRGPPKIPLGGLPKFRMKSRIFRP